MPPQRALSWRREQTHPQPRRFYTVSEAADMFGLSEATVRRAIHGGELPAVKMGDRYLVPVRAVNEMLDAAMTTGTVVYAADWAS